MDLYFIDYFSHSRKSALHGLPASLKALAVAACIAAVVLLKNPLPLGALLLLLFALAVFARVPLRVLPLALYPLVFTAVFLASSLEEALHTAEGISGSAYLSFVAATVLKVVVAASAMLLFLLTTKSTDMFGIGQKLLPDRLVAGFFLMYRSTFILSGVLNDLLSSMRVRGGFSLRHPVRSLDNLGRAFSVMLVRALNLAEKQYDVLRLRGFEGKFYISK